MKKLQQIQNVHLVKLVHGGQAMGALPDGRKVFVWNGLPDEDVDVELFKSKKDYAEGYVYNITKPSSDRTNVLERKDINLSVAPWSIMSYTAELQAKKVILEETFTREEIEVDIPEIETVGAMQGYRNKIEFSFWGDEDGLHYAHYLRATHSKIKLDYPYSDLIPDCIADAADKLLFELNRLRVRAGDLKSVIFRCSTGNASKSKVVAALFVKTETFASLAYQDIAVVYSNPKSPASIRTKDIYINGDITLTDKLLGKNITYDVFSFFQVNLPIFERALKRIKTVVGSSSTIDMYSGVGTIGISLGSTDKLIESDSENVRMAGLNVRGTQIQVVHATSESALGYIDEKHTLILDPPRAGLHRDVVERILEVLPPQVVYLSCNPSTQSRDVKLLSEKYRISAVEGYNFFPHTPHIESLVILEKI